MRVLVAALLSLCATGAGAQDCPQASWPGATWISRADEIAQTRADAIAALETFAFTLTGEDSERKGIRTDGVVIVHDGVIIYERYGRGFTAEHRHLAWSATKSVVNALVGIAVDRGDLNLGDSICDHLDDLPAESCQVTVKHLLEFASGFDWKETYEGESPTVSSVVAMLYGQGFADMARFVASHDFRDPPGDTWMYSSGDTTLLSAVLGAAVDEPEYPWTFLFDRVDAPGVAFERDGRGTYVGSSSWYATPRDMARFGWLYATDGCWHGQRILPAGWVEWSTAAADSIQKRAIDREDSLQGRQWWINGPVPGLQETPRWRDVPEDAFWASGHWGQLIAVIPSRNVVVVRTGDDREDDVFDRNQFLKLALAVAEAP